MIEARALLAASATETIHQPSLRIVAELSYNHFGSTENLGALLAAAKRSGATHAKFERRSARGYRYFSGFKSQYELTDQQIEYFRDLCQKLDLGWFCSVRDPDAARAIVEFRPDIIKIGSREAHNPDFVRMIASMYDWAEVVVSTGGLRFEEVAAIYDMFAREDRLNRLTIAHCVSQYPHALHESNINRIRVFRDSFRCQVGYSGHEEGFVATLYAVFLGSSYVERHFCLSRQAVCKSRTEYTDERCNLLPSEFQNMVAMCHAARELLSLPVCDGPSAEEFKRLFMMST